MRVGLRWVLCVFALLCLAGCVERPMGMRAQAPDGDLTSWLDEIGSGIYEGKSGGDEGYWMWMAVGAMLVGVPMFGLGAALGATALIRARSEPSVASGDPHG